VPTFTCGFLRSNFSLDMVCILGMEVGVSKSGIGVGYCFLVTASAMLAGTSLYFANSML
jgi:hypothetical protein